MPSTEDAHIESIAARTKDSGTIVLSCPGASVRGLLENTLALDIPARAEQRAALRKAFPLGSRVNSLVLLCCSGRRIQLLAPEVVRWEEYVPPPGQTDGPAETALSRHVIVVLQSTRSRQSG
jgi:hypothetical protein